MTTNVILVNEGPEDLLIKDEQDNVLTRIYPWEAWRHYVWGDAKAIVIKEVEHKSGE